DRLGESGAQGHGPPITALIILRLPVADRDRLVDDDAVGGVAGIERGEVDENLEEGSRLTLRLDRAIELALSIIPASDQREDRAVRRERDERRLADAPATSVVTEPFFDD